MSSKTPLFRGVVANTETQYVPVPVNTDGTIGLHIGWKDGTSDADITLETTSIPAQFAPHDEDGDAWQWVEEDVSIAGPEGESAGATSVHVDNVRNQRARLKIEASADTDIEVWKGW